MRDEPRPQPPYTIDPILNLPPRSSFALHCNARSGCGPPLFLVKPKPESSLHWFLLCDYYTVLKPDLASLLRFTKQKNRSYLGLKSRTHAPLHKIPRLS
ncbi:hypothetical protein AAC387_Pa01g2118 [Persea americana]